MSDVSEVAQSEDDFHAGLQEALVEAEQADASAESEETSENIFDKQVAAPDQDADATRPASQELGMDDWLSRFDGVDLSSAPKGAGVPAQRFSQVIRQRNETRSEVERLRSEVEALRQQAQKPAWMDELAGNLGGKAKESDDDAWINSILGEPDQPPAGLRPDQLNQVLEQHPMFQKFNNYLTQQDQARQQYKQAAQLRSEVAEVLEIYPDVPPQSLYRAYVAGENLLDVAQEMMSWRGGGQTAAPARSTPAAVAPPVPSRGPSKPASTKPVDAKAMDDESFFLHMKDVVKQTFGK